MGFVSRDELVFRTRHALPPPPLPSRRPRLWPRSRLFWIVVVLVARWLAGGWIERPRWHWIGEGGGPGDIAFVTSREWVLARLADGMRLWSLRDGSLVKRFGTNGRLAALSPAGDRVASGRFVYALPEGSVRLELPFDFEANAYTPDGKLIVGDLGRGGVALVSASTGLLVRELEPPSTNFWWSYESKIQISRDGRFAAASTRPFDSEARLFVWSLEDGVLRNRLNLSPSVRSLMAFAFTESGDLRVICGSGYEPDCPVTLARLDPLTSELREARGLDGPTPFGRAFARDGLSERLVALGACAGSVRIFTANDGALVSEVSANVGVVRFSPDDRWLAVGGSDDVSVWELR